MVPPVSDGARASGATTEGGAARLPRVSDPLLILLDVQDHDLAVDHLRHRRATLPERARISQARAAAAAADAEIAPVELELAELRRAQKRLEDEVATVEAKASAENLKLYSGNVTAARELQALQEEIAALGRRQRGLEDQQLELMEVAEPLLAKLDAVAVQRAGLDVEVEANQASLAEAEATVDAELAAVEAERSQVASSLPPETLARYESLRSKLDGVAVARLEGNRCLGCHLSLPAMEMDTIRHAAPGAVVLHEECGRILVRG